LKSPNNLRYFYAILFFKIQGKAKKDCSKKKQIKENNPERVKLLNDIS